MNVSLAQTVVPDLPDTAVSNQRQLCLNPCLRHLSCAVTSPHDDLPRNQQGHPIQFHDRQGLPIRVYGRYGSVPEELHTQPGHHPLHDQRGNPIHATVYGQPVRVTNSHGKTPTITARVGGGVDIAPPAPASGPGCLLTVLTSAWLLASCLLGAATGALDYVIRHIFTAAEPHVPALGELHRWARDHPQIAEPLYIVILFGLTFSTIIYGVAAYKRRKHRQRSFTAAATPQMTYHPKRPPEPTPIPPNPPRAPRSRNTAGLLQLIPALCGCAPGIGRLYGRWTVLGTTQIIATMMSWLAACAFSRASDGLSLFIPALVYLWGVIDGIVVLSTRGPDGDGNPMT